MDIEKITAELIRDEGERLRPYVDTVGRTTIGVGRNLSDVGISHEEALCLLDHDLDRAVADLDRMLPWWRMLDEPRQRVLVNMDFNLGINVLCKFSRTLGLIEHAQWEDAAKSMLDSLWARQVGVRAVRLAEMMRTGTG